MVLIRCAAIVFAFATPALAGEGVRPGRYEVIYRLEVPHVERFAVDAVASICVAPPAGNPRTLPVLSPNNPLSVCPARNARIAGGMLSYDIYCPGRRNDRSEAHAVFALGPDRFAGRIHMKMGGKNMTFVEVQSGRRTGNCDLARIR
jgi:hypothetical protein